MAGGSLPTHAAGIVDSATRSLSEGRARRRFLEMDRDHIGALALPDRAPEHAPALPGRSSRVIAKTSTRPSVEARLVTARYRGPDRGRARPGPRPPRPRHMPAGRPRRRRAR